MRYVMKVTINMEGRDHRVAVGFATFDNDPIADRRRQDTCAGDYSNIAYSWDLVLKPLNRDGSIAKRSVVMKCRDDDGAVRQARQLAAPQADHATGPMKSQSGAHCFTVFAGALSSVRLVGFDGEKFKDLAKETKLPQERVEKKHDLPFSTRSDGAPLPTRLAPFDGRRVPDRQAAPG
jgi:hypothetical protein